MRFYFTDRHGNNQKELTNEEARQMLSENQIQDAIAAKSEDPNEEVSYMVSGGFVICEL